MSIHLNWGSLTTGPSGDALAACIRDFIHDKFQQVTLPRFIRSVQVHTFEFGEESPQLEVLDVCDPWAEFYEGEGEEGSEDGVEPEEQGNDENHEESDTLRGASPTRHLPPPSVNPTTRPPPIDTRLPPLTSPFLSRSNTATTASTPGIPGGTSNFSYFHLPLAAGRSGNQTPLPFTPATQWSEYHRSGSPVRPPFPPPPPTPTTQPAPAPATAQPASPRPKQGEIPDRSLDVQTLLHITYSGALALSLTAEILLDYPMRSFVGLPLKLQIRGVSFDGVGVVAYLQGGIGGGEGDGEGKEGGKSTVNFCFLSEEEARLVLGDRDRDRDRNSDEPSPNTNPTPKNEHAYTATGEAQNTPTMTRGTTRGSLLREIRVESEIGRQEGGKQVLKNVGKVERFVLEQVRRIFEEEVVWPSFWTVLV
ncbi:Mitochondrial distribution and morphology protein 12 [Puttea exsequens]|nr:Mitochondrial distribution and morphology protein 12 [Puttea exsequens]